MMENIVLKTLSYGKKSTDKNYIEIIYGSDEKFARPVGISMSSVREHNPHCIFHWFVTKLDDADLNRVKRFSLESDVLCNIYYVNSSLQLLSRLLIVPSQCLQGFEQCA